MKNRSLAVHAAGLAWLLLAAAAPHASAQSQSARPAAARFEPYLKLSGLFFGNFFQTPTGVPTNDIKGVSLQLGASTALQGRRPLQLYGRLEFLAYRGYNNGSSLLVGLRRDAKPHSFDFGAQLFRGRPAREAGDVLLRADGGGLEATYGYRVLPDVEASALLEFHHESYDAAPRRENDSHSFGVAVRYRGFGYKFSPEAGYRRGGRSVVDENEDLSQREAFVKLRWAPTRAAYLTLRYRRRSRDYTVDSPAASNFGREDTRRQWTLSADYRQSEELSWGLYLSHESADSARPVGEFSTSLVQLSATWRF